jgi:hypothetical protein
VEALMPPPILKAPTWEQGRDARNLMYVAVLLEEAHIDPKKIPKGQVIFAMATPYEQRGVTGRDIERWALECDPAKKPAWDPVECFRKKARAAMAPRPGLGSKVALIAGASFLAAFGLARWLR